MVLARHNTDWAATYLAALPAPADGQAELRAALADQGLPSRRVESWRYTDLGKVLGVPAGSTAYAIEGEGAEISRDLSAVIAAAGDALPDSVSLDLLNRAAAQNGAVVRVAKSASLELALGAGHSRTLIQVAKGAELTLIEKHGAAEGLAQHAVKIELAEGAVMRHLRVSADKGAATRLLDLSVSVGRDAAYRHFTAVTGGATTRTDTRVRLLGKGADVAMHGVANLSGAQHLDTLTHVTHAVPDAHSNQAFYNVLGDKARAIYQGKVRVEKGAIGTEAHQLSKALLLNAGAEADHKPELEIFADAVECSHGATTGAIDADQLFYLKARGVPEAEARALLISAFLIAAVEAADGVIPAGELDGVKALFGGADDLF
ncbi:MAG: SufB/SufD family protein [Alphaproteobacteria bacterium]